ncbi:MAG: dihydrolipoyl dehydrogenase [Verrucomicrobia bacterium]|nr:dihydrolipoyl dehydrogenase [Verrucomicrobiota bacterium]
MPESAYDLIVVGGGPGGYVAAVRAAQLGLRVALVERGELGGVCLNWGCIPSKALLRNAEVVRLVRDAGRFGITIDRYQADYAAAQARSRAVAERLVKGVAFLMKKNKVEVIKGEATLAARDRVAVKPAGRELTAPHIIVATGARARSIPGLTIDGRQVLSSREALELRELPASIAIVGASAVGMEFATVFRSYGVAVTVIELLPHLLPKEDEEISIAFEKEMKKTGVSFHTGARVEGAEIAANQVRLRLATPGGPQTVEAARVLVAVGVQPNLEGLGLEALGAQLEGGAIKVDEFGRTTVPGLYAIGDVTMKLALAHVASAQGVLVAELIARKEPRALDLNRVPRCTYSAPQVASLGLTEAQARATGRALRVGRFPFRANGKALGLNETEGFVKMIVDTQYGEILGAHLIGPEVTELTGELSLAKAMELTPLELAYAVHAHPTLTEALGEVALDAMGVAINA